MVLNRDHSNGYYSNCIKGRLDPEVKKLWTGALLSGRYPQGMRMLVDLQGKFCCLGVYCDVMEIPSSIVPRFVPNPSGAGVIEAEVRVFGNLERWTDDGSFTFIPKTHMAPLFNEDGEIVGGLSGTETIFETTLQGAPGLNNSTPFFPITLTGLNDDGFTFEQISDVVNYFL